MRIYILLVLLFFSLNQVSAQAVQIHKSKIRATTTSLSTGSKLTLNLTVLIEGLFDGSNMISDTITVELHDATSPSILIDTKIGILDAEGKGSFIFNNAVNGSSYFIVVKHKNALETWSGTPQAFISSTLSYNFTNNETQAYGNNMILKNGRYCLYSGDVNQDGGIDLSDLIATSNDNLDGTPGYYSNLETDINEDGGVDLTDLIYVSNNNLRGIGVMIPSEAPPSDSLSYEGHSYHIVLLGAHYWLKENLNVGTMLTGDQSQTDNGNIEKYCYGDDPANCDLYGGLYSWDEAMKYTTTPGAQGICPSGWHIPTIAELNTLNIAVSGDGNALKEIGQGTGAGQGTNTSGFSALIGGYFYFGGYYDSGISTDFWSSSENDIYTTNYIYLFSWSGDITLTINDKAYGYSVRCIKD